MGTGGPVTTGLPAPGSLQYQTTEGPPGPSPGHKAEEQFTQARAARAQDEAGEPLC